MRVKRARARVVLGWVTPWEVGAPPGKLGRHNSGRPTSICVSESEKYIQIAILDRFRALILKTIFVTRNSNSKLQRRLPKHPLAPIFAPDVKNSGGPDLPAGGPNLPAGGPIFPPEVRIITKDLIDLRVQHLHVCRHSRCQGCVHQHCDLESQCPGFFFDC